MLSINLPFPFQESLRDFVSYPENLPLRGTDAYLSTRQSYKSRLDQQINLFVTDESSIEVPYRDFNTASGKDLDKLNIHSSTKLYEWLGIKTNHLGSTLKTSLSATGRDPKCRFIYLYGHTSRSELNITRTLLALIFTYHQIMPSYLDFIFVFGANSEARDLRFSGFREQVMIKPGIRPVLAELGRSGQQFQLCYNLKGVTLKHVDTKDAKLNEWSIRQAAIHHQFDVVFGTTLWVVTKGGLDLQQKFKELTGPEGRPEDKDFHSLPSCFRASLATHLLYSHWAADDWRWYLNWLETVSEQDTKLAVIGPREPGSAHKQYKPNDIQDLQYWVDKTNEAVMVLEANFDILGSLSQFYLKLKDLQDIPKEIKEECGDDILSFASYTDHVKYDFKMQIARAKLLAGILNDRKTLVSQHLQGQAAERTAELTQSMEREAVLVRIVTVVTLIYLPSTFVSTFFSTDVVKYQNQGNGESGMGSFSAIALQRWLQVSIPLTAMTLLASWGTYKLAEQARVGTDVRAYFPDIMESLHKRIPHTSGMSQQEKTTLPLHGSSSPRRKTWAASMQTLTGIMRQPPGAGDLKSGGP